ncbi:MAG: ComF family protein [Hellea sp.]
MAINGMEITPHIKDVVRRAVDVILPPQSLMTGSLETGGIEGEIWANVKFLDEPCCHICGFPFEFDEGPLALCGRCSVKRPAYDMARAGFEYDDNSRSLVLGFKHGGRTEGLRMFAGQMRRAGRQCLPEADFIIPVPLYVSRRIKRRYNQSVLLARALSKISSPRFDPDILMRRRATPTQGGRSASARRRNVQGAFVVRDAAQQRLKGARIVLIDDVMTTGATLESCARTLKRAGASHVSALTLARVVKAASLPT